MSESTLSERIEAIQNPITRELFRGLYDDWSEALTIPNDLIREEYHGSLNGRGLDAGIIGEGERYGGSTIARINVLHTLYLEFPEMSGKVAQNAGTDEIRRILECKRNDHQDKIDQEEAANENERRLRQYESDNETDFGIVYTDIDYAARDRSILAFGNLLDHLQNPDTPVLSGT